MATYHTSKQSIIVLGSDAWLKNYHVKRLSRSLRGQTTLSQRKFVCLSPGPSEVHWARLFVAPDTAVIDVGLNFPGLFTGLDPIRGSGQKVLKMPWVGSRFFQISRVGSGQEVFKLSWVRSGQV